MRILGYLILIPMVIGCSSFETVTKTETHAIVPDSIHEILPAQTLGDTVWAVKEVIRFDTVTHTSIPDTVMKIRYYPKLQIMEAEMKFDTIFVTDIDTVQVKNVIVEETSFMEKLGYGFIGAILIAVLLYFLKRKLS